tara:strand:+ start:146 stop:379 length:234 start_codon:yes stop_codon:yes gene_type:complete
MIKMPKEYVVAFLKIMDKRSDELMQMQHDLLRLNQDLFHEKWKFRHVSRILKEVAPHEAITEEELEQQIKDTDISDG